MSGKLPQMPTLEQIENKHVQWEPRLFPEYVKPDGWLEADTVCHGLFFYYLMARKSYEEIIKDPIFIEGDKDPDFDFRQLFKSIARMYGAEPEKMVRFWPNVDMQCFALKLPKLPEKYKFDKVVEIKTE